MNEYCKSRCVIRFEKKQRAHWLFPIFNILAFVAGYIYNIRAGAVACVVILGYYLLDSRFIKVFKEPVFLAFLITNLLSVYAYLFNGRPIQLYFTCVSYNLIPMLLYGIGYELQSDEDKNHVLKTICVSNVVIVVIGLIVYFSPTLALRLGKDSITTAGINAMGIGYRFDSYLDSLTMGSLCAINMPIVMLCKFKKKYIRVVCLGFTAIGLFLTLQRGAWVVGIVGFLGSLAINVVFEKKNGIKEVLKYLVLGGLVSFLLLYFATHFLSDGLMQHLVIRLKNWNFSSMMGERNYQVENGLSTFFQYPLGFGMGAAGIKAAKYGMQIVPDGNILKILVETGITGFILFWILNIRAIIYGIRNKRFYCSLIVILFLCHSIGSNVLDFYYSSFVYWFILGYLSRDKQRVIRDWKCET